MTTTFEVPGWVESAPRDFAEASPDDTPLAHKPEDDAVLQFWGAMGPITEKVYYNGSVRYVKYHILEVEEEQDLLDRVREHPEHQFYLWEGRIRVAMAVVEVDGKPFPTSLDDRIRYTARLKGPLLDELIKGYNRAMEKPFEVLDAYYSDPNIDAVLISNGFRSKSAATSSDKS